MVAPHPREPVEIDARRAMTPARKRRIWEARGRKCWFCSRPVDQEGPGVIYDHVGTLWITGSDADDGIAPIHAEPCNRIKTAADLTRIAKTKRQKAKHDGTFPKSKARIRGGGFAPTRGTLP
jgi:5-methylcytosine-specific restriction protein A